MTANAASLPQEQEYQRALRSYLNGLNENDYVLEVNPFHSLVVTNEPPEAQFRVWLLAERDVYPFPNVSAVTLPASQFLLSSIETSDSVKRPSMAPNHAAWLSLWRDPCNPYLGSRALRKRAFTVAIIDMVMLDDLHEQDLKGPACRSDFLGGTLVWLAYTYEAVRGELPPNVRAAYETGLRKFVARLQEWGPTGLMTDMDLFAPVGLQYAARALRDPQVERLSETYSRPLFSDPRYFHPAGYFVDVGSFDASYEGISLYWATWAASLTNWPFAREALTKAYRLKNHLTLPEPDGQNYFGPSHFSSRTSACSPHDQWRVAHRDIGAAMVTDEALCIARRPTSQQLKNARKDLLADLNRRLAAAPPDPVPWKETHWTSQNYTYDFLSADFYDRYARLNAQRSPLVEIPFSRTGSFIRAFEKTFLGAKFDSFGVIIHTGVVPAEPQQGERVYGFGGGALSAFWTPTTGSVLLGRRGSFQGSGRQFDRYEDWRLWPTHAVSGLTADDKVITSGRTQSPETIYRVGDRSAEVRVNGLIPDRNCTQGQTLKGEVRYERRFAVSDKGLEIETSVNGDGKDHLTELYEILPVFLRETRLQKEVPCRIQFQVDGTWKEASAEPCVNVNAVEVARFSGSILVRFDRPRRVRLAPEVWKDLYQSSATCRNIMIDLLETDTRPTTSGRYEVNYSITANPPSSLSQR